MNEIPLSIYYLTSVLEDDPEFPYDEMTSVLKSISGEKLQVKTHRDVILAAFSLQLPIH